MMWILNADVKTRYLSIANPVDIERFQSAVASISNAERSRERERCGLRADGLVALFVGKFINIKRPLDVVNAADLLRNRIPDLQILMIGSGPLEGEIRSEIARLQLEDRVLLSGFINQAKMPRVLQLGDFLITCSEVDPHPLAVTEAMSVGNAVIASDRVGCVGPTDAAREGQNALVYPCGDIDALCACILEFASNREKLSRYGACSVQLSHSQGIGVMVDAVRRALVS